MKNILKFPGLVLRRAGQGMVFLKGLIFKSDQEIDPTKLYGDELKEELERVKQQSNEFKNQEVKKEVETVKKLTSYRYVVRNNQGQIVKGIFDGKDEQAVRVFLSNEGYEILEITKRGAMDFDINIGSGKIGTGDLSFALVQLGTYIKAGIPQTARYCFANNKELTQVVFPAPVDAQFETPPNYLFSGCSNLRDVEFEEGCKYISTYMFNSCNRISYVHIPSTMIKIGSYAFSISSAIYSDNYNFEPFIIEIEPNADRV